MPGIIRKPISTKEERSALQGALILAELVPDRENIMHALQEVADSINHVRAGGYFLTIQTGIAKSGKRTRFKPQPFGDTGVAPLNAFIEFLGCVQFSEREAKDIHLWARLNAPVIEPGMTVAPSDIFQYVDIDAMNEGNSTNHNDDIVSLI